MSDKYPIIGFAEIPLNPSDPPHFSPTVSAASGATARRAPSAFSSAAKVSFSARAISTLSRPVFCWSKTSTGFVLCGSRFSSSSISIEACAFWQPRLSTVAPATLG